MIRTAVSLIGKLPTIRGLSTASAIALIAGTTLYMTAAFAAAQVPGSTAADMARLVGNWSAQTKGDGVLTVTISEDRILGFKFTGGEKDHGMGTFRLQSPDQLLYTPINETDAEHWTYGFDSAGHLKLKMEQDDPKDVEEYSLSRVKP